MKIHQQDYSTLFRFFDAYSPTDFKEIDPHDLLLTEVEQMMEENNQLFYIGNTILYDLKFISKRVVPMFGMVQSNVSLGYFITTTHPDDLRRHNLARTKILSSAQEQYMRKGGIFIISFNVRGRKPDGSYCNYLHQCYQFYNTIPYESVYIILVITDISGFEMIHKGFHYYVGDDPEFFRFPDNRLLSSGIMFSHSEYIILELIEKGLSSKEIADKLNRSLNTINNHRANILIKSGKASITEVLHDLKVEGLL